MGRAATHQLTLATAPSDDGAPAHTQTSVVHDLRGEFRLYLSENRNAVAPDHSVHAFTNQSYTLTLRFRAPTSGWSFDERLELSLYRPVIGYHGTHSFERSALPFAAGEQLQVTVAQADWRDVLFDDWRGMHAVVWSLQMCGVPQNEAIGYNSLGQQI